MKLLSTLVIAFCLANYPAFSQDEVPKRVIVLDPRYSFGQNNSDNDFASEVFQMVKDRLTKNGYKVFLIIDGSGAADMNERIQFAKEKNADLYLSLSFYNIDQTKYGRKQKDLQENYRIYPAVAKNPDTTEFTKAKSISNALQSEILQTGTVQPKIFGNAFVYDIPHYGLLLSISYKPGTAFYERLKTAEYQQRLAASLASAVENML